MEIQHFSHDHILKLCEVKKEGTKCYGCLLKISGAAYFCEICHLFLHKSCAEFPRKMQHPFHSLHPLILLVHESTHDEKWFECDECRNICRGFRFNCDECNFNLDMKCASLTDHPPEHKDKRTQKVWHFSHKHELSFYITREEFETDCIGCELPILGPAYGCAKCHFLLHESCSQLPQEMQHAFHPLHRLTGQAPSPMFKYIACNACQDCTSGITFSCADCDFYLDALCTSLTPTLKHKRHEHKLAYFTSKTDWQKLQFWCHGCNADYEAPFYRCVECNFNLHLKCALPDIVKHKCHIHPLILLDKFVEDDSGEYYCDACETERDANHAVYYRGECMFAAHIECIITEGIRAYVDPS